MPMKQLLRKVHLVIKQIRPQPNEVIILTGLWLFGLFRIERDLFFEATYESTVYEFNNRRPHNVTNSVGNQYVCT